MKPAITRTRIGRLGSLALLTLGACGTQATKPDTGTTATQPVLQSKAGLPPAKADGEEADLPLPSTVVGLGDYQRDHLLPWLGERAYTKLGWAVDVGVRDTGPFANQIYYGVHPAVRIWYSPKMAAWLNADREGPVPDGAIMIKEMFTPPAAIYEEIQQHPYFVAHPDQYEAMLEELVTGWTIMIMDRAGGSKDGWYYAEPGAQGSQSTQDWLATNVDTTAYQHPPYGAFGVGTCSRCHASAERENTFAALANITGRPLEFRHDDSWRSKAYLNTSKNVKIYDLVELFLKDEDPTYKQLLDKLDFPPPLRPWRLSSDKAFVSAVQTVLDDEPEIAEQLAKSTEFVEVLGQISLPGEEMAQVAAQEAELGLCVDTHSPPLASEMPAPASTEPETPQELFVATYSAIPGVERSEVRALPQQWSDHVFPGPPSEDGEVSSADQYITSSNCLGCHGGLAGEPPSGTGYPISMFVKTGPKYGDGYDVSEYGEWRWSPMGLAGRDPIFHTQLETELILLAKDGGELPGAESPAKSPLVGSVEANQKALINTCLSCHGAMGARQLQIDADAGRTLASGNPLHGDFNPDYYYLVEGLTAEELAVQNLPQPRTAADNDEILPVYEYAGPSDYYDYHEYGELAREGISCAVCHHITGPATTPEGQQAFAAFETFAKQQPGWLPKDDTWSSEFIYFLAQNTTGQFERTPANELAGPYADDAITRVPMENALGITPKYNPFTASSDMCGTCHTINLPNIGLEEDEYPVLTAIENNPALKPYKHSIEQATYLEWLNSQYGPGAEALTAKTNPNFRSCQSCHMPNRFETLDGEITIDPFVSQIASIQDTTYPEVEHALPLADMTVPLRNDYRRHQFTGLNAFLVEIAGSYSDVLGLQTYGTTMNYETSATNGPQLAIESMLVAAKNGEVVTVDPIRPRVVDGRLEAEVRVTNQTGHRLPSGVAFRRLWLEFSVLDARGKVLWVSGSTNAVGVILDGASKAPLSTEFLNHRSEGNAIDDYQPNYQVISRQDQVQIYEELTIDANDEFTTSFIHRVHHVKDNRLLPKGWVPAAEFAMVEGGDPKQGEVLYEFMQATEPSGPSVIGGTDENGVRYEPDCDYAASCATATRGTDVIRYAIPLADIKGKPATIEVRVLSQSLMPAWLYERFELAAEAKAAGKTTPATDRLYYLTSHLDLEGTPLEDWKIELTSVSAKVGQ